MAGKLIATNNNWKHDQRAQIQATGIAPTDNRESAVEVGLSSDRPLSFSSCL